MKELVSIPLKEIKGLDRRVRQVMSPTKLEELADSIGDMGLLQPVKVRKNGNGYTLVFGHRRVMAAKAAGLKEIDAIVEDLGDDMLLRQALTENVVREDMAAIDIAKACQLIVDGTGCLQDDLGKELGWTRGAVSHYLAMLEPQIRKAIESGSVQIGVQHVKVAKAGTQGDIQLAARVLQYAGAEELSVRQTRRVADVVFSARQRWGERAVKSILSKPYERMEDIVDDLENKQPKSKKATEKNAKTAMAAIEKSIKVIEGAAIFLASSKEARAVAKASAPKWTRALRAAIKTLESI